MVWNIAKANFSKGGSTSNIGQLSLPACQFIIEFVNNKLEFTILGSLMENRKTQVFPKMVTSRHNQDVKDVSCQVAFDILGEENFGLPNVDFLSKMVATVGHSVNDGATIGSIGIGKKEKVIDKEKMRDLVVGPTDGCGVPSQDVYLMVNST